MTGAPLDRPVWSMLTGPQAALARGDDLAVRIDPGFGPFAAARDASVKALAALGNLALAGEDLWLIEREEWPVPPGMELLRTARLVQMMADNPMPPQPGDATCDLLGEADAAEMTALALATKPGPWGEKTRRYGQFYGIRDGGKLAAMAGERMRPAPGLAEVSAVCTWPDYRGQGLAGQLIRRVMAGFTARGDLPFLHSYAENAKAIGLYQSLGFEIRCEMVVTVVRRVE
ncbi:MAG: GNAT family N-acetyltransferase [Novosphingobium sp.]|uniref:GNAT family N-acetyltransferase n=1 Tax=Novosphingobium sp. TaxID=1874826 RepID=UPI003C7B3414